MGKSSAKSDIPLTDEQRGWVERYYPDLPKIICSKMKIRNGLSIRHLAMQFAEFDDAVQCAAMGLVDAAQTFDPDRGIQFLTHAVFKIAGRLQRGLKTQSDSVGRRSDRALNHSGVPLWTVSLFGNFGRELYGRRHHAVAPSPGMATRRTEGQSYSSDCPDSGIDAGYGYVMDEKSDQDRERFEASEAVETLTEGLSQREKTTLLRTSAGAKLHELGREFGVSKERVRQIKNVAMEKVRRRAALAA